MANFSITVTNMLDIFGPAAATRWNAFLWGSANWGQSADLGTDVTHYVDTTLSPTSDPVKYITHFVDDEGTLLDSDIVKYYTIIINEALSLLADMQSEQLQEQNGYFYTYPDRTIEGESRASNTFTAGTRPTVTWAQGAAGSTVWS